MKNQLEDKCVQSLTRYKKDFKLEHKGHLVTYAIVKSFSLYCTDCKSFHIISSEVNP